MIVTGMYMERRFVHVASGQWIDGRSGWTILLLAGFDGADETIVSLSKKCIADQLRLS